MKQWLFSLLILSLAACSAETAHKAENPTPQIPTNTAQSEIQNRFAGSDVSKENMGIDFALPATNGKTVHLSDTQGKVTILVFGYANCPDVCPTNLLTYADAIRMLGEKGKQTQLYFITVDPKRDTLARMKEYVTIFYPDFLGLVADDANTLDEVKKAWRIVSREVPLENGNYLVDHSAGTYLIDRNGKTTVYEPHGLNAKQLAHDLQILLE